MARKRRVVKRRRRPGTKGSKLSAATRKKISRGVKRALRRKGRKNPPRKRARVVRFAPKRTRRRRRNPWTVTKSKKRTVRMSHSTRPKRKYRPIATYKGKPKPRLKRVGRNPVRTLKQTLPIYGGMLAVRALGGLFAHYVTPKLGNIPGDIAKVLPAGAAFLFSTLVAPKIKPLAKNAKLMQGMQLGSTVLLFDSILKTFILPKIPATSPAVAAVTGALAGYDDVGVMGYGYGSYIADPTLYELPGPGPTAEPGVGLDVHEAMALDEYIADSGMGFDVAEALAGTEVDYMQRGGAGGSLAKTVFTD